MLRLEDDPDRRQDVDLVFYVFFIDKYRVQCLVQYKVQFFCGYVFAVFQNVFCVECQGEGIAVCFAVYTFRAVGQFVIVDFKDYDFLIVFTAAAEADAFYGVGQFLAVDVHGGCAGCRDDAFVVREASFDAVGGDFPVFCFDFGLTSCKRDIDCFIGFQDFGYVGHDGDRDVDMAFLIGVFIGQFVDA